MKIYKTYYFSEINTFSYKKFIEFFFLLCYNSNSICGYAAFFGDVNMKNKKVKFIVDAAVIAALYVVLTYLAAAFNLSRGVFQVRFSEALTILPVFTPAAIPGLFVGCILANALTGAVVIDVICGSIATLIGAVGAWLIGKYVMNRLKYAYFLAPLPTIIANAAIVPFVLRYAYGMQDAMWYMVLTVGLGEIISAGMFGVVLYLAIRSRASRLF